MSETNWFDRVVSAMWRWRVRDARCPNPMCGVRLSRVEVTLSDGLPVEFKGECPTHGWMVASSRERP